MAKPRPNPPALHMLVAMVVLLIPVLLIVAWFTRIPEAAVNVVDYRPVVQVAREESPYPVLAPESLPDGWVATRARWIRKGENGINNEPALGNTMALGFLNADKTYLAVDQRDELPELFTRDVTRDGHPDGESQVAGQQWLRFVSDDGRTHALVRNEATHVSIVSGDVPYEQLEQFAGTLTTR
ncbi:DUF4245 domain-containing protein [Nigerium massiliense]|uniref:DUF4245 domain-containing protein n=1 Tax=Nigerium massiliense TaxID=1522317 RepID=UPI000694F239|nr:DUF4245 domain-containing protein [Nigerium massiliense]